MTPRKNRRPGRTAAASTPPTARALALAADPPEDLDDAATTTAPDPAAVAEPPAPVELTEAQREARDAVARAETAQALAAQQIAATRTAVEVAGIEHAGALKAAERDRLAAARAARDALAVKQQTRDTKRQARDRRRQERAMRRAPRRARRKRFMIKTALLSGTMLFSGVAVWGQSTYLNSRQHVPALIALPAAIALEITALMFEFYALYSKSRGRPWILKMAAALGIAGLVSYLNMQHFADSTAQQGLAIPMLIMSAAPAYLWLSFHQFITAEADALAGGSTSVSAGGTPRAGASTGRAGGVLEAAAGQHGQHAPVTFTAVQWAMAPLATFAAMRYALTHQTASAVEAYEGAALLRDQQRAAKQARQAAELAAKEAQRAALNPPPNRDWRDYLPTQDEIADMESGQRSQAAFDAWRAAEKDGVDITGADLGRWFNRSESWGRGIARKASSVLPGSVTAGDDDSGQQGDGDGDGSSDGEPS